MKNRFLSKLLAVALAAALALPGASALAATTSTTFNVTATVTSTCTVTAANVAFGSYTGVPVTNTASSIALTCNKGTAFTSMYLTSPNTVGVQKNMKGPGAGTENLAYSIDFPTGNPMTTCPAVGAADWGAATGPTTASLAALFATTGGTKSISICANVPAAQYPTAGSYSDTVTVTVIYI